MSGTAGHAHVWSTDAWLEGAETVRALQAEKTAWGSLMEWTKFWVYRFKTNVGGCWFDFDLFCWLKISENTNIEPLSTPQSERGLIFSECQHLLKVLGSEERSTERGWGNKDWVLGYSLWRQDTNTLQKSSKPISSLSLVCHRSRRVVPGPMQTCTAWPTS